MKRIFPILVLFLLFIVLPLGSYLYLSGGVDYRLAALEKIQPKGELLDFEYYLGGVAISSRSLKNKTVLIHINEGSHDSKYLQRFYSYLSMILINIPFSSMMKDLRSVPMYFLPYMLFSTQTP